MFLGQYVSKLMQETIRYLKLPYDTLAHEMSIPELVLRDAVEGKMGLTRGQWVKFGRLLGLPTIYQLRPGERDGRRGWLRRARRDGGQPRGTNPSRSHLGP